MLRSLKGAIRFKVLPSVLILQICFLALATPVAAAEFTYYNLLHIWMKLDRHFDYAAYANCYMSMYRSDVWNRYKNDEFRLQEKRTETIELMKRRVDEVVLGDSISIPSRTRFGEYDFDNQKFSFNPFTRNTYFYKRGGHCQFPDQINVKFSNFDLVDGIAMSTEDAQKFLDSRKDSYGNVNRNVQLEIDFVPQRRDGNALIGRLIDVRLLDQSSNAVIAHYTAVAEDVGIENTSGDRALSLMGWNAGGTIDEAKAKLPPGSVACNAAGAECEIMLDSGEVLKARVSKEGIVQSLEHRTKVDDQPLDAVVDNLKLLYGDPIGDTVKEPRAAQWTNYGQIPAQSGVRSVVWHSDTTILQVSLIYGFGRPIEIVSVVNNR
ncbi:MAG: DUF4852 domain-containing protein [Parvibaculum sp.]|nr:DUF4852 domain-containing protein [Parvibaculum sp.]